jgi:hypothetical protein
LTQRVIVSEIQFLEVTMQKMAIAILLTTITASSYAVKYQRGFEATSEGHNPDGSITITKPVMYRGNKKYEFSAYHTSGNGLCRSLGYKNELKGYSVSSRSATKERAYLNSDGNYVGVVEQYDESINAITCLRGNKNNFILRIGKVSENRDGSVTISNPILLRGTQVYDFSAYHTSGNGLCQSMGFKKELKGYATSSSSSTKERAYLNSDGNYVGLVEQYDESVATITCLNNASVLVLEDNNGNLYISKERVSGRAPITHINPVEPVGSYDMHPKAQALSKTIIAKLRPLISNISGYYATEFLTPIKEQAKSLNIRSINGANRRTILNSLFHLHSLVEKALAESGVANYELNAMKVEIKSLIDSI